MRDQPNLRPTKCWAQAYAILEPAEFAPSESRSREPFGSPVESRDQPWRTKGKRVDSRSSAARFARPARGRPPFICGIRRIAEKLTLKSLRTALGTIKKRRLDDPRWCACLPPF